MKFLGFGHEVGMFHPAFTRKILPTLRAIDMKNFVRLGFITDDLRKICILEPK